MTQPETAIEPKTEEWDTEFQRTKQRFPSASDSTLFCIAKLDADPSAEATGFKDEAALYGLRIGVASMRRARELLGLIPATKRLRASKSSEGSILEQKTLSEDESPAETLTSSWQESKTSLELEFSETRESILFCAFKLRQDPELTIPDFREEAKALGIRLGGRSLHSARVLLGLAAQAQHGARSPKQRAEAQQTRASKGGKSDALGTQLVDAIRQIEEQASQEATALRSAITKAVEILRAALDEP